MKPGDLYIQHPSIIFEVLADLTALDNKEVRLKYCKKIESLQYYVLVSQKEIMVEVYNRIYNTQIWKYQPFEIIVFDKFSFTLPIITMYDTVSFEVV